ncbi:LLM class flavin-dependent oxidoreductase [Frankia sp. CNm7]|uniref:LLM class flavin-dependent oxidoreductase n=1 Tax=Frankia nepalensis TaxID=1836974 RepID=A0A937UKM2_9ACTN|nr:LLM class flavin-dependent oxidoreductase [Frankia nepalensis]MBL7500433.1 LLM class flavin-dependent oxidoreductase [Frankia nepalensis]MBL7511206.1 LLM class flavin-dependent oxidoreductase [Frankia nepalensis]MBL7522410.1 LLM class flavin-dependent oxidoreductase [Frankia nepalensis]MBL7626954.1 LLM class flavin-dependent oxidoreductase [Frankia nepalensis]
MTAESGDRASAVADARQPDGSSPRITSLAFLTPGNYPDDDPYSGLEETLSLFELGERLGFDGGWIRQRHLEHGVSSAAVFLAAATQRTRRIELGTAVIPIGYESPFRLAEDLATVDVLARGRLQPGFSAGMPPHADLMGDLVFDGDWRSYDLSYGRIARLVEVLRGGYLGDEDTLIHSPGNVQRPRQQPHAPGLADRVWYGGGSLRSVRWAAESGLNLLTGNVINGEVINGEVVDGEGLDGGGLDGAGTDDFVTAQLAAIREYRRLLAPGRPGRIALGRVIVPFDGADRATRDRYRAYAASRYERTLKAHGERRILFAVDLVGDAEQIVEQLLSDAAVAAVSELRIELPYEFDRADYEQILRDVATLVAPALGWRPATDRAEPGPGAPPAPASSPSATSSPSGTSATSAGSGGALRHD